MSQVESSQPKLTKKQKKAATFKSVKKGKGKAVVGDATPQAELETPTEQAQDDTQTHNDQATKLVKPEDTKAEPTQNVTEDHANKSKKRKRKNEQQTSNQQDSSKPEADTTAVEPKPPKKRNTSSSSSSTTTAAKKTTFGDDGEVKKEEKVTQVVESSTKEAYKASKYILFIGNMSFNSSSENIAKHFGHTCGETPSVRLLTKKVDPNVIASLPKSKQKSISKGKARDPSLPQSKGCAFLEFKSNSAMLKALNFHHTMFDGRQINVELTAGGGGKSATRQEKIKKKNESLENERKKLHEKFVVPAKEKKANEPKANTSEPPKKKVKIAEEGTAQWGSRSTQRLPRFMATGSNAVKLTDM